MSVEDPEPPADDSPDEGNSAAPDGPSTEPPQELPSEPPSEAPPEPPPPASATASPRRSLRRAFRDYCETVLVAILIVLFTTTFAVQNSVIPSASMEDTLLVGDYILVNKIAFAPVDSAIAPTLLAMREIRRGDVVVFKYPHEPETDYIKRVVGLPGDVIQVQAKALLRNGVLVEEPWAIHRTAVVIPPGGPDGMRDHFGPVRVPDGMLFMMGDNRDYSRDSREFGFVPRELVTGRAFCVFWSKSAPPGAYRKRGPAMGRLLASLRSFHRDVRWGRLFTIIR